jgi:hypothetical protein
MNSEGLLMIQEHRAWSSLANNLYDCLSQEEKNRLFNLIEERDVEDLVLEEYGSNSATEILQTKSKETKR